MSDAIRLEHLSFSAGKTPLLRDISLTLQSGTFYVVIGPNGAGKTSLLKTIAGDYPTKAPVYLFDKEKSQWPRKTLAQHLAVLPQQSSLSFPFKVNEVVGLGAISLDCGKQKAADIAAEKMAEVQISHLAQRKYPFLSGGEKQRVHFARVLTQLSLTPVNKQVLLLDEPTSALDITHQHELLDKAKSMAKQGACVVAVIHDLNLAAQYADQLIGMKDAELFVTGTPAEVIQPAIIHALYDWLGEVMPHPKHGYPVVISS